MNGDTWIFLALCGGLLVFLLAASFLSKSYSLDRIKSKTVGDGQHGTARWATPKEIGKTYHTVPFRPRRWRKGKELPTEQGLILGSVGGGKRKSKTGILLKTSRKLLEKLRRPVAGKQKRKPKKKSKVLSKIKKMIEEQGDIRALVDSDDIHCLMIGASGVGKTAFFLYPNLEYACACGMSYLALDTKGDLARNYGAIASRYYGYRVSVIDLRNPTRSDGFNFLTLMNHYMDIARADPSNLAARAKAEKYAKILAKTIISPDGDASQYGDNAYFYDSAEGLLTAVVLLLAEFVPPKDGEPEKRHIVSAFKLVQDLLAMPSSRGRNGFQLLVDIQAKLAEGKGGGYERWAKKHNLKEMSKTLLFLQEQKISSADELKELADAALSHYHELGDSIKASENRLAEIAVLKAHITNYAKTRPVYDAYRKTGYSKRFLETHRTEITLHKAAKAAFDEANLKKLPKVKELDAEYSKLLTEKKVRYPDYRKAKEEMQELLRAKRNVEMFFAEEKSSAEKTKSR